MVMSPDGSLSVAAVFGMGGPPGSENVVQYKKSLENRLIRRFPNDFQNTCGYFAHLAYEALFLTLLVFCEVLSRVELFLSAAFCLFLERDLPAVRSLGLLSQSPI